MDNEQLARELVKLAKMLCEEKPKQASRKRVAAGVVRDTWSVANRLSDMVTAVSVDLRKGKGEIEHSLKAWIKDGVIDPNDRNYQYLKKGLDELESALSALEEAQRN